MRFTKSRSSLSTAARSSSARPSFCRPRICSSSSWTRALRVKSTQGPSEWWSTVAAARRPVIPRAALLLQAADLPLQLLDPRVGREIDVGRLRVDVEDRRGRASAGDLQRLVEEAGRQALERQGVLSRGQLDIGNARDNGAVGVDRRGRYA